jgi:hypothetical protein
MPVIGGLLLEQKTVTMAANDGAMNAEIEAQAEDGWTVQLLILNGSNMTILFSKQSEVVEP